MFSSSTCFLFILTILLKSRIVVSATLPNGTDSLGRRQNFEGFIVGGRFAKIQDFPHSAFLAISCRKQYFEDFTCGSSILNQWLLLTAAHCFEGCLSGTKVIASVGSAKKTKGTFHSISKFANHKKYDGDIMKNDICVVMLSNALTFGNTVKRIQLTQVAMYDEPAVLAGWGVTNVIYFLYFNILEW